MQKRPIDLKRDAAISGEISSPDDPSRITDTVVIDDQMFVVKELGIYKFALADEVDPSRTNPSIAHTHQKTLSYGSSSTHVCRTLLTAKRLFDSHFLPQEFDGPSAMKITFSALEDLCAMTDQVRDFEAREAESITKFNSQINPKGNVASLPTLDGVAAKTKSIIQRADHFCGSLLGIARLFYGEHVGKKWFESFYKMAVAEYGEDDDLVGYLREVLPPLRFVRYMRDAVEHPNENARAVIKNFELKANGEIFLPSIEVIHDKTPQSQISVVKLFKHLNDQLGFIFEGMVVSMCAKKAQSFAGSDVEVGLLPEGGRCNPNVRYAYFTCLGDRWVPYN